MISQFTITYVLTKVVFFFFFLFMGLAIFLHTQLHILIFYALDFILPSYPIILGFVDNI